MARLFFALELPEAIKSQALILQGAVPEHCQLVALANMHMTLVFIGAAELEQVRRICTPVRHAPFSLNTDGLGCFTQERRHVLWLGIQASEALLRLREQLLALLQQEGLQQLRQEGSPPEAKTFRPHITLARCRSAISSEAYQRFMDQPLPEPMTFQVNHFTLFSSETQPKGPVYRVVDRYGLKE